VGPQEGEGRGLGGGGGGAVGGFVVVVVIRGGGGGGGEEGLGLWWWWWWWIVVDVGRGGEDGTYTKQRACLLHAPTTKQAGSIHHPLRISDPQPKRASKQASKQLTRSSRKRASSSLRLSAK
jgi:hypothetical protein